MASVNGEKGRDSQSSRSLIWMAVRGRGADPHLAGQWAPLGAPARLRALSSSRRPRPAACIPSPGRRWARRRVRLRRGNRSKRRGCLWKREYRDAQRGDLDVGTVQLRAWVQRHLLARGRPQRSLPAADHGDDARGMGEPHHRHEQVARRDLQGQGQLLPGGELDQRQQAGGRGDHRRRQHEGLRYGAARDQHLDASRDHLRRSRAQALREREPGQRPRPSRGRSRPRPIPCRSAATASSASTSRARSTRSASTTWL